MKIRPEKNSACSHIWFSYIYSHKWNIENITNVYGVGGRETKSTSEAEINWLHACLIASYMCADAWAVIYLSNLAINKHQRGAYPSYIQVLWLVCWTNCSILRKGLICKLFVPSLDLSVTDF